MRIKVQLTKTLQDSSIFDSLDILASILGISGISAVHLLFEIGRVDRFPSKRISCYGLGYALVLTVHVEKFLGIILPTERMLMFDGSCFKSLVSPLRTKSKVLKAWYLRLKAKEPDRVVLVTLARKLLAIVYTLMKLEETFFSVFLRTEVQVSSTVNKLLRDLVAKSITPLLTMPVEWLNASWKFQASLSGVFHSM